MKKFRIEILGHGQNEYINEYIEFLESNMDDVFEYLTEYQHNKSNERLTRKLVSKSFSFWTSSMAAWFLDRWDSRFEIK